MTLAARTAVQGAFERIRVALSALLAGVLGVLPHVLHHVGPLAGAVILGGLGGSLLFGAAGLVLAVPFLLRLRRRTGGWRTPMIVLALFAVVFSISSFVIGPAISGGGESTGRPTPAAAPDPPPHEEHH